jgi:hypothetical protein
LSVLSEWVSVWLYTGEEPDAMYVIRSGLVSAKAPGQPLQMIGIGNVISIFSNFVGDKICMIIKIYLNAHKGFHRKMPLFLTTNDLLIPSFVLPARPPALPLL